MNELSVTAGPHATAERKGELRLARWLGVIALVAAASSHRPSAESQFAGS